MFTDQPLSTSVLIQRLNAYRFFSRSDLPLGVARNALHAAKQVALESPNSATRHQIRRTPSLKILEPVDDSAVLEKIYAHPPVLAHVSCLWRDLLLMKPYPPLSTETKLLNLVSPATKTPAIDACLRIRLGQRQFVPSFRLLDQVEPGNLGWFGVSSGLLATGWISGILWLSSPILAGILAAFWGGLAYTAWTIGVPKYPYVQFDDARVDKLSQIRRLQHIRMANTIVAAFYELGTTTTSNYHRRAQLPEAPRSVILEIDQELHRRGMKRAASFSESDLMYADYWSPNVRRWQNVEWHEPDQDPAEKDHEKQLRF